MVREGFDLYKERKNLRISKDLIHAYSTDGRYALHHLIRDVARQIGPCHLLVTSHSLSVKAALKLNWMMDERYFDSAQIVVNNKQRRLYKRALNLLHDDFVVVYQSVHAKMAFLWNKKAHITILHTGNLSENNNIETGLILDNEKTFDFYIQELTKRRIPIVVSEN